MRCSICGAKLARDEEGIDRLNNAGLCVECFRETQALNWLLRKS